MKILFYSWLENIFFSRKLAKYLEENHKELNIEKFTFLTMTYHDTEMAKTISLNTENEIINMYEDFSYDKLPKISFEELRKYEKLYGIPNLWLYIVTEREFFDPQTNELYYNRYKNVPKDKVYDLIIWHIKKFEDLFDKGKFDILFTIDFAGFESLALHNVAKIKNCTYLYYDFSRFPGRVKIAQDFREIHQRLKTIYDELINRKLTKKEEKLADELLSIYRKKKTKLLPIFAKKTRIWNFMNFKNLFNIFEIAKKNRPRVQINIFKFIYIGLRKRVRVFLLKLFRKIIFDEHNIKDRYFYYPLHDQPELATDYINPFLQNQIELISNIAKALPAGYVLYVKDHSYPVSFGTKPVNYYMKIKKIHNVRMLYHFTDGYSIIENCKCVLIIHGTAGWEAFLLGKPVITFGEIFFNLAKNSVFNITDFFDLALVFQKVIEDFKPNEEQIKRLLLANYYFTYPGKMYSYFPLDEVLSEENVKNFSDAFISEYNRIKTEVDNKKV